MQEEFFESRAKSGLVDAKFAHGPPLTEPRSEFSFSRGEVLREDEDFWLVPIAERRKRSIRLGKWELIALKSGAQLCWELYNMI